MIPLLRFDKRTILMAAMMLLLMGSVNLLRAQEDFKGSGEGVLAPPRELSHRPVARVEKTTTATTPRRVKAAQPKKQATAARMTPARREKRATARATREKSQPSMTGPRPVQTARNTEAEADAFNDRGDTLYDAGQYEPAIEAYKQAVRLDPDFAEAYESLGDAYLHLNRNQEAAEAYKQAVRLDAGLV